MNGFADLLSKDLYHSYIVEGDPGTTPAILEEFLIGQGSIEKGSIDMLCQNYDSFGVDDSAQIKEWHSEERMTEGKRICIISTKFINHDAERALLKMLEEPQANTHFFIIVPQASALLDTIISRSHVICIDRAQDISFKDRAKKFVGSTISKRIDIVAELVEEHKDSENSGALRFGAMELIKEIEQIYYERFEKDKTDTTVQYVLAELAKNRDYLRTPGAGVKMILEHIALVI
jgi:DNA polymerase III delta prime subunit